jgi:hypothetical protein
MAIFCSTPCPVFSAEWIGENRENIFYAGGGGSAKTGVKNALFVSRIGKDSPPSFSEVASLETGSRICTTAHADQPRGGCQLIVGGLGNVVVVFGISPLTEEIIPLTEEITFSTEVTTVAFDSSHGHTIVTGDASGVVRLLKLDNVDDTLKWLAARGAKKPDIDDKHTPLRVSKAVKKLVGHTDTITSLQFDQHGRRVRI